MAIHWMIQSLGMKTQKEHPLEINLLSVSPLMAPFQCRVLRLASTQEVTKPELLKITIANMNLQTGLPTKLTMGRMR